MVIDIREGPSERDKLRSTCFAHERTPTVEGRNHRDDMNTFQLQLHVDEDPRLHPRRIRVSYGAVSRSQHNRHMEYRGWSRLQIAWHRSIAAEELKHEECVLRRRKYARPLDARSLGRIGWRASPAAQPFSEPLGWSGRSRAIHEIENEEVQSGWGVKRHGEPWKGVDRRDHEDDNQNISCKMQQ